jgi:glucose-6-phosphate 1-dehydrogenase
MTLRSIPLDLFYARSFSSLKYPDAYERLLMDVVRGNLSLFMGLEEVMAAWSWTDNLLSAWDKADQKLEHYAAGTDGPLQASLLLDRDGRAWWNDDIEDGA